MIQGTELTLPEGLPSGPILFQIQEQGLNGLWSSTTWCSFK